MFKKSAVIKIGTIAAALFVLVWNFPAVAELYPALQEPPIILQASDILPKDLRVGPGFRLEETVKNDGLINTYQLKSLYGAMTLESTAMLRIRINELKALHRINMPSQAASTYRNMGHLAFCLRRHYRIDDQWLLQGGIAYDTNPVDSVDRTADIPIDRQVRVTLSVQLKPDEKKPMALFSSMLISVKPG